MQCRNKLCVPICRRPCERVSSAHVLRGLGHSPADVRKADHLPHILRVSSATMLRNLQVGHSKTILSAIRQRANPYSSTLTPGGIQASDPLLVFESRELRYESVVGDDTATRT